MTRTQRGFTIIELIVVIALLGILSAVALPRFINVTSEAHDASVEGAGAGFATGIALLKAQVVANGDLGAAVTNVTGYGDEDLDVNSNGYPVGTDDGATLATDTDCANIWGSVLDANGPSVKAGALTGADNQDFGAVRNAASGGNCTYTYKTEKAGSPREILYVASTGTVSVTIPD